MSDWLDATDPVPPRRESDSWVAWRAARQIQRIRRKKFKTTTTDWADCPAVVLSDFDEMGA